MNKIIFEKVGSRLKQARELKHITLEEAGRKVDVHKSTVLRWENGETEKIKLPIIETLASYYNVNPVWLMGYDAPMKITDNDNIFQKIGAIPLSDIETVKIPILGTVKGGYDYLAQENIIDYIALKIDGSDKENYYALYVVGNSMEPLFDDGDIVIVHKQDDFENGENCVVLINGDEATIKKVYKRTSEIELKAVNPYYPSRIFTEEEIKNLPIKVIGVVEKSIRNLKKNNKQGK